MTKWQTSVPLTLLVVLVVFGVLSIGGGNLGWNRVGSQEEQEKSGETVSRSAVGKRPSRGSWLQGSTDGRFQQVERQLRGFDKTMVEVGYRFTELYFAGQDGTGTMRSTSWRSLGRRSVSASSAVPNGRLRPSPS